MAKRTSRNARKQKRKPQSDILSDIKLYYPLFSGWTQDTVPLFHHASEALCWQFSRYYKDSICHSWPDDHFPNWMHFIGGLILDARFVPDPSVVVSSYNIKFTSLIEKAFFDNVVFWQYTGTRARTAIVECDDELFSLCQKLFKSHPDYQSSSTSIYVHNSKCHSVLGKGKISLPHNVNGIPQPRCSNNLISIGQTCKVHAKSRSSSDIGMLMLSFIMAALIIQSSHFIIF